MNDKFTGICLSGGAEKGFIEIGVLHYYEEINKLDQSNITGYAGSSIGSIICLLMICGYTPIEIFTKLYSKEEFLNFEAGSSSFRSLLEKKGMLDISTFTNLPKQFVIEKFGHVPTLKKLYELTNIDFYIRVTNVTKTKMQVLSHKTDPDLDCITAVGYSASLPGVFYQSFYKGDIIVDGGLTDNVPISLVNDGHRNILAVVVLTTKFPKIKPDTAIGYIYLLAMLAINSNSEIRCESIKHYHNITLVKVDWESDNLLLTTIPSETKMKMFLKGIQAAENKENTKLVYVFGW